MFCRGQTYIKVNKYPINKIFVFKECLMFFFVFESVYSKLKWNFDFLLRFH